jgi:PST family polysaccharide transporter
VTGSSPDPVSGLASRPLQRLWQIVRGRLARNVASLFMIRAADQITPLLVIPFIARWLGPEGWGLVAVAQSLALYGVITVQYGFDVSGTRAIAQNQGNEARLAELVGGFIASQLALGLVVVSAALVVAELVPAFTNQTELVVAALASALAQGFVPLWYFLGRERVALIAIVSLAGKAITTIMIFILIEGPGDEWLVLMSFACGNALASAAGFALILRDVRVQWPGLALIRQTLRYGFALFLVRMASMIQTGGNAFLLGLLVAPAQVAAFAAGEKLCRPVAWLLLPINVALLPRLAHRLGEDPEHVRRLVGLSVLILGGIGLVFGLLVAVLAPWLVVLVFGTDPGYAGAVTVLRIMAVIIPLNSLIDALANQWLIPNGLDRALSFVTVSSMLLNVGLAVSIAPTFGAQGMAWVTIAVSSYMLIGLLVALHRNRLWPELPRLGALLSRR